MTTDLQLFQIGADKIRFGTTEEGTPYAVASDFAKAMGYTKTQSATDLLDEDEKGYALAVTPGGNQRMLVIYEDGIWELIFRSGLPEAKKLKKRVKEILSEIRRTGGFIVEPQPQRELSRLEMARMYHEVSGRLVEAEERAHELELDLKVSDAQRLALAAGKREAEEKFEAAGPMLRSYQHLMDAEGTYSMASAAQILNIPSIGRNKFFDLLRSEGLITKHEMRPIQTYLDRGIFVMKTGPGKPTVDGFEKRETIRVTPKGLEYLRKRFCDAP